MVARRLNEVGLPCTYVVKELAQDGVGAFECGIGEVVFDSGSVIRQPS